MPPDTSFQMHLYLMHSPMVLESNSLNNQTFLIVWIVGRLGIEPKTFPLKAGSYFHLSFRPVKNSALIIECLPVLPTVLLLILQR